MENPEILYHGSPDKNIEIFEPGTNRALLERGEIEGVRATPSKALASAFIRKKDVGVIIGSFDGDKTWFIVVSDKEKFLKNDQGGAIYCFSPDNFNLISSKLGKSEYTSPTKVRPIKKEEFSSGLESMLNHGVQVYLLTPKLYRQFEEIKGDNNKEIAFLSQIESENQKRNINPKS